MNSDPYAFTAYDNPTHPEGPVISSGEMIELIQALNDERGAIRLQAAARLKERGDERAIEPICGALTDLNPDVRTTAARALIRIGDASAVEPLCRTLKDTYRDVRIGAAEALGRIGDAAAIAPLSDLFKDMYQDVRAAASDALANIGSPAVDALSRMLRDTTFERLTASQISSSTSIAMHDPNIAQRNLKRNARRLAAAALGKIGDLAAVEPLCDSLRDADPSVRLASATALYIVHDSRAVGPLCAAFKDPDMAVRTAASRALIATNDLLSIAPLCRLLKDYNRLVRSSALEVLKQFGVMDPLPFRVLTNEALTPSQQIDALLALSSHWSQIGGTALRIGNVQSFCAEIYARDGVEPEVKRGAAGILIEIKNRAVYEQLVRASDRSGSVDREELLRGVSGSSDDSAPSELMRAADASSAPGIGKHRRLFGKLFKRIE